MVGFLVVRTMVTLCAAVERAVVGATVLVLGVVFLFTLEVTPSVVLLGPYFLVVLG